MDKSIGNRIKEIRQKMNLNKEQFARLIGISGQYLGTVESREKWLIFRYNN